MKTPLASLITIGDELLIGQTIDTNSAYIAQALNQIGIWVQRRVAVGDKADDILETLRQEHQRSSIIIMTGGLGPTADDITKPLLCRYFGAQLVCHQPTLDHIQHLFKEVYRRPGALLDRNKKQADVPDNCQVLHNPSGTAPGMLFVKEGVIYIALPGVPREMKDLMQTAVLPYLQQQVERPAIVHRHLLTCGIGESMLAEQMIDLEESLPSGVSLAYLPNYGMVKLRLTAKGEEAGALQQLLEPWVKKISDRIKRYLVTDQDISLEAWIGQLLLSKNATLGTAESCTGGMIAQRMTAIPGASAYFKGSVVCYANETKESVLGVPAATLQAYGAVSEQTATAMAKGALQLLNTDYVVAVSGIMGPTGGSKEKPVGTVCIALASASRSRVKTLQLGFDRERNTQQTTLSALNLLREFILEHE